MILRRLVQHIKEQNWSAVFLEMLIVVFGVYLGILLGDIQSQSEVDDRVNVSLSAIRSDLQDDLLRLDEIIDIQTNLESYQMMMVESLSTTPINIEKFTRNLNLFSETNATLYPSFATYSTLKDEGYMPEMKDTNLRLAIGRLYEREFVRALDNARIYDDMRQSIVQFDVFANYDFLNQSFFESNLNAHHIVRNSLLNLTGQTSFYLYLIKDIVRPQMAKLIAEIDEYLVKHSN